jgi:hypothetical protein
MRHRVLLHAPKLFIEQEKLMKTSLILGLFFSSACFAGTLNCQTKEIAPHSSGAHQNASASYTSAQGSISLASQIDPQILFEALGDDRGVSVSVKDARTGISAQNMGMTSGTNTELDIPSIGDYSIYCTTTSN